MTSRVAVLGLQNSGKTTLVKALIYGKPHCVFDPLNEYGVQFNTRTGDVKDFISEMLVSRPQIVVLEEASRYSRLKEVCDYLDIHRHLQQPVILVCRRPTQLSTDALDLAEMMIVFNLPGANDRALLEAISPGLGDVSRALDRHDYVIIDGQRRVHFRPQSRKYELAEVVKKRLLHA